MADESAQCVTYLETQEATELTTDQMFERLGVSKSGLSSSEAAKRLRQVGPNAIEEKKVSSVVKFLSYFWGPIPWMIEIAAVLSLVVGDWDDFIIISVLLLVNAFIGFWEEFKADNAITALKSKLALHARTMRDGAFSEIPAADLVPGDMIHVRLGDVVPADAKILSGTNITVDQAALTGESLPVEKESGEVLYSGSVLQRGEAESIVYATGAHSFFGKTAKLVAETKVTSHYQKAVMKIGNFLIGISLVLMVVIVIASLYHHRPFIRTLEFALVLAVAAIPVALPAVLSVTMVVGAMALSKAKAIVSRLVSIEEMAGMDVLCSDKTGTLTKNQLTLGETTLFADVDELQVLRDAALASKIEDKEPIETAIFDKLEGGIESLKGFDVINYIPFDPVTKRTEATVKFATGQFKVSKGAPQMIAKLCEDEGLSQKVSQKVDEFAKRGYRTLGVARTNGGGKWTFTGLLSLFDPPRDDSASMIKAANDMGVEVKMVTGDHLAIARETAQRLGMGPNFYEASKIFAGDSNVTTADLARANGSAQGFPEHKYKIVEALEKAGHLVGMTGDGVNDAPALKKADAGVAVSGATDAARGAADLILTAPGLSVIITAIKESRKIFQRMTSYVTYRIAETIDVLIFMTLSILLFQVYPLSAVMIIILAMLNDLPIMMIAYDNVLLPAKPVRWDMKKIMSISLLLGFVSVGFSFMLFWFAGYEYPAVRDYLTAMGSDPSSAIRPDSFIFRCFSDDTLRRLTSILPVLLKNPNPHLNPVGTLMFLKLAVAGHMTLYMARTGERAFWRRPWPNWKLLVVCETTQMLGLIVGIYGFGLMAGVGWRWGIFILCFALGELVLTDIIKVIYCSIIFRGGSHTTNRRFKRLHQRLHTHPQ